MEERVAISITDGVADVRLVRADKMNALDAAMFEALVAATERLSKEKGVRAVVLSGEGRAFCAGLDMGRFAAMKETGGNGIAGGEKRDLLRSRRSGVGASFRCRSLPPFRAWRSGAASSSRSAPICAS
jgi:enoyl-CoA hydratase/carnithine racemase